MWTGRRRAPPPPLVLVAAAAAVVVVASAQEAVLRVGFYRATCPIAEDVVLAEMRLILMEDDTLAPSLLRMHYHDCFVQVSNQPSPASRFQLKVHPCPVMLMMLCSALLDCSRQGLRRIDHAPVEEGEDGAGRAPQPQHARVRRHRADQGPARDRLPAHRLLRRHHRHGGQGRRLPEPRAVVRRGDRAARRQRHRGRVRRERPSAAGLQHRRREDLLQRQVAQLQGHRRPLRVPQHRDLPLRPDPEAALQLHRQHGPGPVAGPGLRRRAQEALPAAPSRRRRRRRPRRREDEGVPGPRQQLHLRPELLPARARHGRAVPVRRQPPPRPRHQGVRREGGQRVVAGRVLRRLRGGDGQDGPHRRARRRSWRDQADLRHFC